MCVALQIKYLVWVSVEIEILQETGGKFTEQEVVCVIDGPETPVRVVVGAGACTKRTHYKGCVRREWKTLSHYLKNKTFHDLFKSTWCDSSLVQKGDVCQWWLSWVKQVRPGMLHVSLFWSLLRNLRSFFLRFCSFCSHSLFCLDGILWRTKHFIMWACKRRLTLSIGCPALPERVHPLDIQPESFFILHQITMTQDRNVDVSVDATVTHLHSAYLKSTQIGHAAYE